MADFEIIESPVDVDWVELHALVNRAFAYMAPRINPPSSLTRMDVAAFKQKAQVETLLIVQFNGELVACMFCNAVSSDWLYVGKVAVESHYQGQGISRQLFKHAAKIAKRHSLRGLELETRIELVENHRTFEKLGFVKVGEDAHEGFTQPTNIRMRLEF